MELTKTNRLANSIAKELEELGIRDTDELLGVKEKVKRNILPKESFFKILANDFYAHKEVEEIRRLVGEYEISASQLLLIINALQCQNIHSFGLALALSSNIIDFENMEPVYKLIARKSSMNTVDVSELLVAAKNAYGAEPEQELKKEAALEVKQQDTFIEFFSKLHPKRNPHTAMNIGITAINIIIFLILIF